MGATNCPETPRQKMITMMYLVYTAMLALNVSAEVIQGFKSVGTAMHDSNKNIAAKLEDTYMNFDIAYQNSPDKVREMYERAQEIKSLSREITAYIDSMECEFIGSKVATAVSYTDPGTKKEWDLQLRDENGRAIQENVRIALDSIGFAWFTDKQLEDNHAPAQFFIGGDVKNPDPDLGAIKIKNKLSEFVSKVNNALGDDSSHIKMALNLSDDYNKEGDLVPWEVLNFNEVITGAALVTLTRLKSEMMNAEFDAVNLLYKKVNKGDHSFDQIMMLSRPKSTYIIQGGVYESDIYVGAYDSKAKFTATINGQTLNMTDSGSVHYRVVCNNLGPQRITGTASVTNAEGTKEYPISDNYFVAKPMAVVSLDNMLVVYAGIENPITVSVPGVDSRNLRVTMDPSMGKIRDGEGAGKYIVIPNSNNKRITLNVQAVIDRQTQNMGDQTFRVKAIPDPVLKVGSYDPGAKVFKKEFNEGTMVGAVKNKDFEFKVERGAIRIQKMNITVGARTLAEITGNRFNPEVVSAIKKANKGDKLIVDATVMMPDGKPRTVTSIITLK